MTAEKLKPCDETWKDVPGWEELTIAEIIEGKGE